MTTMLPAHEPAFIVSMLGEGGTYKVGGQSGLRSNLHIVSSSDSRSTSPGSSPPSSPEEDNATPFPMVAPKKPGLVNGLPECGYPAPFAIPSPFVDMNIGRPFSLDDFYEERRVHSCPIGPPPGLEPESVAADTLLGQALTAAGRTMKASIAAAAAAQPAAATVTQGWAPLSHQGNLPTNISPLLQFARAPDETEAETQNFPTLGSQGHQFGNCKPCAFLYTKGCGNGVECPFCHLCPPGEKKRRKKEKVVKHRSANRAGGW